MRAPSLGIKVGSLLSQSNAAGDGFKAFSAQVAQMRDYVESLLIGLYPDLDLPPTPTSYPLLIRS